MQIKKISFFTLCIVCAFFLYLWKKERSKPIFHPFGANWAVTDKSLLDATYNFDVFEGGMDVPALGKIIGDTLSYYCLNYDCIPIEDDPENHEQDCIFEYANSFYCIIKLPKYDSMQVVRLIESYGGKIILDDSLKKSEIDTATFWVAYPNTSNLFRCTVNKPYQDRHYQLSIYQSNPLYDKIRKKAWEEGDEKNRLLLFFRILAYHIRKKLDIGD